MAQKDEPPTTPPVSWSVSLNVTDGTLSGSGLTLLQCPVCFALVPEEDKENHTLWHLRHV